MNKGKIVQIIGPVVDAEFTDSLPAIYNALTVEFDVPGEGDTKLTLEVQQHLGDNWVRAVAMSSAVKFFLDSDDDMVLFFSFVVCGARRPPMTRLLFYLTPRYL